MPSTPRRKQTSGGRAPRRSRIATGAPETSDGRAAATRTVMEREVRRLELRCLGLEEHAATAERARTEMLSALSHDLRNPLSVVLVSSRLLLRSTPADHPNKRSLDAISRAADEMNQMLQDFNDAARIEEGRLVVTAEPHDVGPLVLQAIEASRPAAEAKPLRLQTTFAGDLGAIPCDRDRIVKVVSSLLGNAIKFTPKGGSIMVSVERDPEGARVAIRDTGPGIPDEQHPRLFSPMTHGPSARPGATPRRAVTQGVGIALFVARGVVEAHGGRMWAESAVGSGSTFFFTLPAAPSEEGPLN